MHRPHFYSAIAVIAATMSVFLFNPWLLHADDAPTAKPAATPKPAPSSAADSPGPSPDASSGPVPVKTTNVDYALHAVKIAQAAFDAFIDARKAEFEQGDLYVSAKKAVEKSAQTLESLQAPLREKLKASDVVYARALQDIVPARQKLADAITSRKSDDIAFRRSDVQYLQGVIAKAETPVFSANEPVKAAQAQLDAANEKLASMHKRFQDSLDANDDYKALARALSNAQARLTLAREAAAKR